MGVRKVVSALAVPAIAALLTLLATPSAQALPIAPLSPEPVAGIPAPCAAKYPWPAEAGRERTRQLMQYRFNLELTGQGWTEQEYRPIVKIIWETLDAVSCTDYLATIGTRVKGPLRIHAGSTRSWAWGDWSLTHPGALTFDFSKFTQALAEGDPGRLVRLVIHELGHVYNVDRFQNPTYWATFVRLQAREGQFSGYGGNDPTEALQEVLGYYVARCAKDNPYDKGQKAYYAYARAFFNGVEFGPGPGIKARCSEPARALKVPASKRPKVEPDWVAPNSAHS